MPASIQSAQKLIIEVTSDASGSVGLGFTVPRAGKVVGVTVISTVTSANAIALVSKAGAPIAALAATPVDTVTPAVALDQDNVTFDAGDELRVVTAGAADRCTVVVDFHPTAAPALNAV